MFAGWVVAVCCAVGAPASMAGAPRVLRVGTYHGVRGQFKTIQAAVKAAKPNDFILVAPGDYKTTSYAIPSGSGGQFPAGVLISTPDLTLRGMNRNTAIVDGTKKGPACTDNPADQNYGPSSKAGLTGLNGIMVWKADDVAVENLTACNFLGGAGGDSVTGNEIWWNGGANGSTIGGWGYTGSYLNATSTFFNAALGLGPADVSAAEYGIFSSDWDGGTWHDTYASNMSNAGYYIGACRQLCNQVIDHGWGEYDALGYSGSNSGGSLIVENSTFDYDENGINTNSQNGDNPPPQDGECPGKAISPITHTHSCLVFLHNYLYDNNNPNVPTQGEAAAGPVGTGLSITGGRYDTVMDNTLADNDAWGVILAAYPDSGPPCTGGVRNFPLLGNGSCLYDDYGDALIDNRFINDGSYGHPTNGAFAQLNLVGGEPGDCYSGNTGNDGGPLNAYAAAMQQAHAICNFGTTAPSDLASNLTFFGEVLCDSQVELSAGVPAACPSGPYPRVTAILNGLHPMPAPSQTPTMPNPCQGVPANPWCPKKS
ncbi:MAG: hypothetical protein ACLP8S_24410 [Solirubrobacteraceae bacterium]